MGSGRLVAAIGTLLLLAGTSAVTGWDDDRVLLAIPAVCALAVLAWVVMRLVARDHPATTWLWERTVEVLWATYFFTILGLVAWWGYNADLSDRTVGLLALAIAATPIAAFLWLRRRLRASKRPDLP